MGRLSTCFLGGFADFSHHVLSMVMSASLTMAFSRGGF